MRHCQVNLSRSEKPEAGCAITLRPPHSAICSRFSSEDPQRRSRDEMALKVEGVVDGSMHAEEALSRSSRFEALHLALSSPHRLMRILGAIILPEPLLMRAGQPQLLERRAVGAQFVGHQQSRHKPLFPEKLAHQA